MITRITSFVWQWPDHGSGMCYAVYDDSNLLALCPEKPIAEMLKATYDELQIRSLRNEADTMIREVDQQRQNGSDDETDPPGSDTCGPARR